VTQHWKTDILPRMITARVLLIAVLLSISAVGEEARRPPITGIEFVRIYAKNPAASRTFYTKTLLLPESKCPRADCARYQIGKNQYVEVVKADENQDGLQVIAFRTANAEGLRRYMAAHDLKVPDKVKKTKDGLEFEFTDSEDHRIAFVQPKTDADQQGAISHRLIHVGFIVHNPRDMDPLFRDVLGFRPYWHGGMQPDRTDWVSIQVPDGTDWIEYMLNVPVTADHHLVGVMNHLALGVENMDTTEAALMKTGWQPHGEEQKQLGKDGKMQLNVFDSDEVRVEFMNFKSTEKPCCSEFTGEHSAP
jgi:catechol 2,3-dioxygenase-like lactoylglutathione lyase family enzyme